MTRQSVQELTAKDIMTTNLIIVSPDEDVSSALGKMQHYDINEVPVVTEKGKILGLINYETLLKKIRPAIDRNYNVNLRHTTSPTCSQVRASTYANALLRTDSSLLLRALSSMNAPASTST
jgi:predicted transcriptional regulator